MNSYLNIFLNAHYQPKKMLGWRIITLCLLALTGLVRDYQAYQFGWGHWFVWLPLYVLLAGLLTINFQSLYLGSMSFQYRHWDTAFTIARQFYEFDYPPLVAGMTEKLARGKLACNQSYVVLISLLIGVRILLFGRVFFLPGAIEQPFAYAVYSIYILSLLAIALAAAIASMVILIQKRQLELLELSLFWIESASSLKFVE